jgi:hypothetical protein
MGETKTPVGVGTGVGWARAVRVDIWLSVGAIEGGWRG